MHRTRGVVLLAAVVIVIGVATAVFVVAGGLVLGVVGAFLLIGLATWLVPTRQVAAWRRKGVEEKELAKLGNEARATVVQALGGFALVLTLALTAYQVNETRRSSEENLRIAEEGQVTERFARAVEQLGARNPDGTAAIDIRIGALFSLRRIGNDSDRDTQAALLVVASYVANNHQVGELREAGLSPCSLEWRERRQAPRADVGVALKQVLPVLSRQYLAREGPNVLAYVLEGVDFAGTDLSAVDFYGAGLERVSFRGANLNSARFERAFLGRVDFQSACLANADFREVNGTFELDMRGAFSGGAQIPSAVRASARS
jgi:uncharacterized protein YjbI with pentapeptide repeats